MKDNTDWIDKKLDERGITDKQSRKSLRKILEKGATEAGQMVQQARQDLLDEIKSKLPKKMKEEDIPNEINGYPVDKDSFRINNNGHNDCLEEITDIINKI